MLRMSVVFSVMLRSHLPHSPQSTISFKTTEPHDTKSLNNLRIDIHSHLHNILFCTIFSFSTNLIPHFIPHRQSYTYAPKYNSCWLQVSSSLVPSILYSKLTHFQILHNNHKKLIFRPHGGTKLLWHMKSCFRTWYYYQMDYLHFPYPFKPEIHSHISETQPTLMTCCHYHKKVEIIFLFYHICDTTAVPSIYQANSYQFL
jgi:hypothetical protein